MKEKMLAYLQNLMDEFMKEKERFGEDDRIVSKMLNNLIACKEMTEALIGEPVNLQMDGKVTIGF